MPRLSSRLATHSPHPHLPAFTSPSLHWNTTDTPTCPELRVPQEQTFRCSDQDHQGQLGSVGHPALVSRLPSGLGRTQSSTLRSTVPGPPSWVQTLSSRSIAGQTLAEPQRQGWSRKKAEGTQSGLAISIFCLFVWGSFGFVWGQVTHNAEPQFLLLQNQA